jgi:hypothetical protein
LLNLYEIEAQNDSGKAATNLDEQSPLDVAEFRVRDAYTKCLDAKIVTP